MGPSQHSGETLENQQEKHPPWKAKMEARSECMKDRTRRLPQERKEVITREGPTCPSWEIAYNFLCS